MKEIQEKFIRSRGKGGQNVNKVETGVMLKHLPSGLVVRSEQSRSQSQNRIEAYRRLTQKLREREIKVMAEAKANRAKARRQKPQRSLAEKTKLSEAKKRRSRKKDLRKKTDWI